MPSKSLLRRGFKKEAEDIGERYRAELSLAETDPLDAFILAKHLEIPVFSVSNAFEGEENNSSFIRLNNPANFSAMWMPNEDGDKIIIHNDKHSPARQQSNIMHEIAHILLEHSIPNEVAKLCALYGLHYVNPLHEEEAKCLGGCLQMTRKCLEWAYTNLKTENKIAEYYNASVDMVKFRTNSTGVLIQRFRARKY